MPNYPNPFQRVAVGRREELSQPGALKAGFAEFLATVLFVFAAEGSVIAYEKLAGGGSLSPSGLTVIALANGVGFLAAVSFAFNLSGGHVNPAVTLGLLLGGQVTLFRGILYWIAQLIGAVIASLLLLVATGGPTRPQSFAVGESRIAALILEIVMTFGLVLVFYAVAIDPRARENIRGVAPLVIGLVVVANTLVGGAFDGGSMNPARAFGPAFVSWKWHHHWVYWVGPIVGGGLAGIIYQLVFSVEEDDRFAHEVSE